MCGVMAFVACLVWVGIGWAHAEAGEQRRIEFAGQEWFVRSRSGGPGGAKNQWSDSPESVWVDEVGRLHLKLREEEGIWKSVEVYTVEPTVPGVHQFQVEAPLDSLDPHVRVGLFLYSDEGDELDIEFAQWSPLTACQNASFSIHPVTPLFNPCVPSSSYHPFSYWGGGARSSHTILWAQDVVTFRTIGLTAFDREYPFAFVQERTFDERDGTRIPAEATMRVHINVWLSDEGTSRPAWGHPVEVIIVDVDTPVTEGQGRDGELEEALGP